MNSSNPRQLANINDGRVTLQPIQGRKIYFATGTTRTYTPRASGSNSGKQRTVICYNYKGEGHMSKQCTQRKRKRDATWFKDNGQILHEEELAFLADPGIAKVALMVNLSRYGSDVLAEFEPKLYDGNVIKNISAIMIPNSEETLMLTEESRSKMLLKQHDTENSMNSSEPSPSCTPTKVEVPKELPKALEQHRLESKTFKVKMNQVLNENDRLLKQVINKDIVNIVVNYSVDNASVNVHEFIQHFKKHSISLEVDTQLNQEIFQRDNSVLNKSAPNFDQYFELNELKAQSQEKDTVIRKLKEKIKSLSVNVNEENVKKYIDEIESINIELEHSLAKLISENENLRNEREHLKSIFKNQFDSIKKTHVQSKEHSESLIAQINAKSIKNSDLNAQLQEKHTMEQDAILRETVEQAKSINPLDSTSYTACKYDKIIQELLGYIRDTCPDIHKPSAKLVKVTPINSRKTFRFAKPIASSSTNQKTQDSNKPLLHSTGVKCSTSASRSKPLGDTKNNRISQPSSSHNINKVEDQPKSIKSRKNKKNRVNKTECNDHVMPSMFDVNSVSESISNATIKNSVNDVKFACLCAICDKCMIDANHDECVNFIVSKMNVCLKSKTALKNKKLNIWKHMGKIFTKVGLKWNPTRRTFTLVDNMCPLTRIISTKAVPTKKTTPNSVDTVKP
ncbi:hypothetical protein Tco_0621791 [Tanacetum coccineum]